MTQNPRRFSVALSAAVLLLLPATPGAQLTQPPADELKYLVKQREEQLTAAQVALASALGRLARAEGKSDLAAAEWRKVIAHLESRVKEVERMNFCSAEPEKEARGKLAVARAWLADMEGRRDDLRAELPKAIAYYELRVQKYQSLVEAKAIEEQEAKEGLNELREELQYARGRLAALRKAPANQEKNGKGDKP